MREQGFEWDVVMDIIRSAKMAKEVAGVDIFPVQIAMEVHYLSPFFVKQIDWAFRDMSPAEIFLYFEYFFKEAGYVLAERRDNPMCTSCSEVLLVRAVCDD